MYLLGYTCQHKNRVARVGRAEGVEEEEVIERRRKKKKEINKNLCRYKSQHFEWEKDKTRIHFFFG